MTTQRTLTEIETDLANYRAARTALVTGERVEDVWKDGRRLRLATLSLAELNVAINDLLREHAEVTATTSGRRSRSAIGVYF